MALEKVRYPLYLPVHIKQQLEEEAYRQGLSLNSLIIISINNYLNSLKEK